MDPYEEIAAEMMTREGPTIELEVLRERDEPGRSFSVEAMDTLTRSAVAWIGTRIIRRWDSTEEPPSVCRVTITVDVG